MRKQLNILFTIALFLSSVSFANDNIAELNKGSTHTKTKPRCHTENTKKEQTSEVENSSQNGVTINNLGEVGHPRSSDKDLNKVPNLPSFSS